MATGGAPKPREKSVLHRGVIQERCPLQPFQSYSPHLSFVPSQPGETKKASVLCLVGLSFVAFSAPFQILPPVRLFLWPEGDKRNTFQIVITSVQEVSCDEAKTNEKTTPLVSLSGSGTAEGEILARLRTAVGRRSRLSHAAKPVRGWTVGGEETFQGQLLHPQFGQRLLPFVPCQFHPRPFYTLSLTFPPFLSCHFLLSAQNSRLTFHLPSKYPQVPYCSHLYIIVIIIAIMAISYQQRIMCLPANFGVVC